MTKIRKCQPFWSTWSRFLVVVNVLVQFANLEPFYMYFAYVILVSTWTCMLVCHLTVIVFNSFYYLIVPFFMYNWPMNTTKTIKSHIFSINLGPLSSEKVLRGSTKLGDQKKVPKYTSIYTVLKVLSGKCSTVQGLIKANIKKSTYVRCFKPSAVSKSCAGSY